MQDGQPVRVAVVRVRLRLDRFRKKRDEQASDKENEPPKAANVGRKKSQNAIESSPAMTTAQLSIVQKAGLATYQEAMLYEDLSRVPRTDEKALTEAFRATIDAKIRDRVSIIQSKEKAKDDCVADYNALSALNFVKMLLKPMRSQIADCRSTLSKAEDALYGILVERRRLTARETHERQVIAYYSQLLRELEQLRGEEAEFADVDSDLAAQPLVRPLPVSHREPAAAACGLSPTAAATAVPPMRPPPAAPKQILGPSPRRPSSPQMGGRASDKPARVGPSPQRASRHSSALSLSLSLWRLPPGRRLRSLPSEAAPSHWLGGRRMRS